MEPRGTAVRATATRLVSAWLAGLVLAPFLVLVAAQPVHAGRCDGDAHIVSLDGLTATPMSGQPTTAIQFTVTYRDTKGCEPSSVTIGIPGVATFGMSQAGGAFKTGMTYVATRNLPLGTWAFGASATSGAGAGTKSISIGGPGLIVISAPSATPTPKPTPTPTPRPTATPRPKPAATAKPAPTATAKPGHASPTAKPKPSPKPAASQAPSPDAGSADPSAVAAGLGGGAGPGGPEDGGPGGSGTTANLGPSDAPPVVPIAVTGLAGLALVVVATQLRRRPQPAPAVEPLPVVEAAVEAPPVEWAPVDMEPDAGRQGELSTRAALRFAHPPKAGTIRGTIAYRHVKVSAGPDDLRSPELARLERADEVEVIGEHAGYFQVRMPDGVTGWVRRVVFLGSPGSGIATD